MSFRDKLIQGRVSHFFLMLVLFFLPLSRSIFVIAIWPWILSLLLESFLNRWHQWSGLKKVPVTVFFLPGLLLLLLISLLWTDNQAEGWSHIGRSALLLIFPVLLGFDKSLDNDKGRIRNLLKSYTYGVLLSLLILLSNALMYSLSVVYGKIVFNPYVNYWEHAFFYDRLSFLIQPTYYGMMILMGAMICINEVRKNNLFSRSQFWPAFLGIIFIGSLFLISSRAVILAAVLVIAWFFLATIKDRRILLGSLVTILATTIILLSMHPRISTSWKLLREDNESLSFIQLFKETERSKTWLTSLNLLKEYPVLGVGIGDVKDELTRVYTEEEYFDESKRYLNCHNQFLESWVGVGILGPVLLIILLVYPVVRSQFHNRYLYWSFLIITSTGFLFESLLNRLWGVAFFSIFYILLTRKDTSDSSV